MAQDNPYLVHRHGSVEPYPLGDARAKKSRRVTDNNLFFNNGANCDGRQRPAKCPFVRVCVRRVLMDRHIVQSPGIEAVDGAISSDDTRTYLRLGLVPWFPLSTGLVPVLHTLLIFDPIDGVIALHRPSLT